MALIANPEVLAVGRESCGNRQLSNTANVTVWAAEGHADTEKYVAVFNVNDEPMTATVVVAELPGVPLTGTPPASRRGFFFLLLVQPQCAPLETHLQDHQPASRWHHLFFSYLCDLEMPLATFFESLFNSSPWC